MMASSAWLTYACRMHADRLPNHFTIGQATLPGLIATEPDCVSLTTELARA